MFLTTNFVNCQTLTIKETLYYINTKIENNKDNVIDKHATYLWEMSPDGQLSIKRYWVGELSEEITIFIKQLDENKVLIAPNSDENENNNSYIQCYTIDRKDVVKIKSKNKNEFNCFFVIQFRNDADLARQLKNAIIHLIKLGKQEKSFRSKDPFDY